MTFRLLALALESWMEFDGWAAARKVDPVELRPGRLLNLIWHWATEGGDPKEIQKFRLRVWQPPKNVEVTSGPWSAEAEMGAFSSLKAQLSTG